MTLLYPYVPTVMEASRYDEGCLNNTKTPLITVLMTLNYNDNDTAAFLNIPPAPNMDSLGNVSEMRWKSLRLKKSLKV